MLLSGAGNGAPAPAPEPVVVEKVLQTIQAALSIDQQARTAAESLLRSWESDAAPGFLSSLMRIVEQQHAIDESTRLLATVIAKNAVGSSWRKTLGTREWSRVPDDEKHMVKEAAISMLLSDPSDRVATQLGLLLTNIARFDFPGRAENLLSVLMSAAAWDSQLPPNSKLRALKALRCVLNGLSTKRFVIDPGRVPATGITDLIHLSQQINQERELYKTKVQEAFEPLRSIFMQHCQAFINLAPSWELHGPFAKAAIAAITELLCLSPSSEVHTLPAGTREFLELIHRTCIAVLQRPPGLDAAQVQQWQDLGGKLYERMSRCVIAYLDHYTTPFAEYVPFFLSLFVENALIALDAATVRSMRPKRRVLLVRFIAKALLNPYYRPEWVDTPMPVGASPQQQQQIQESKAKATLAHEALSRMLSNEGGQCSLLVEAVISKYVALANEELEEWQNDPESYARSMDIESGPEADTPRPIGVGLLLCMLERGGEPVVQALISLASRLQAQPPTPDSILMREAVYRCIGEGYTHVSSHINFQAWYENELSAQLVVRLPDFLTGRQDLTASVLQARALWLLGVCGQDLPHAEWCSAYKLVVQHMASRDLVVALTSVSSAMALTALILEDQSVLDQYMAAMKPKSGMPNFAEALQLSETAQALQQQENEGIITAAQVRVEERLTALSETMMDALNGCFTLLARLMEVESMVRVLQLVSVLVEVMGARILPHLGIIAAALPRIWEAASRHSTGPGPGSAPEAGGAPAWPSDREDKNDTGAVVRLHSALIAVLTHLVGKLRSLAVSNQQVASVIFPLLRYSTSLGSPESECLVEEAFRLWNTTICSLPEVTPALLELLPNLGAILRRGKDNTAVFPIIESYLLLGAANSLNPLSTMIQQALVSSVTQVTQAVLASVASQAAQAPAFSPEMAQEAMAASALADVMLQLFPSDVPALLHDTFRTMVALLAHPAIPASGTNVKILNVMEGFLEVLGRLFLLNPPSMAALMDNDAQAMHRFLDKWLIVAGARFLEEILGVKTMAMLGRYRRRIATVSLCTIINANACPIVYELQILVRIIGLAVQAVLDNADFFADQADLDALDFKSDLGEDYVLVKRLQITRGDVIRNINLPETVRGTLQKLAARAGGDAALLATVSQHGSPRLVGQLRDVLSGTVELGNDNDDDLLHHVMMPSGSASE